jgi:hypothetical protein
MDKLQLRPLIREGAPEKKPKMSENIFHGSERKIGSQSQMVA